MKPVGPFLFHTVARFAEELEVLLAKRKLPSEQDHTSTSGEIAMRTHSTIIGERLRSGAWRLCKMVEDSSQ